MASILDYGWHEWLCKSNFSFLMGASHPQELLEEASQKSYSSLCLNDFDGAYGLARAYRNWRALQAPPPQGHALQDQNHPQGHALHSGTQLLQAPYSQLQLRYGAEIHLEADHHKPPLLQNTLVLVAQSWKGYSHLCQILSKSHETGGKRDAHILLQNLSTFPLQDLVAIQPMRGLIRHNRISKQKKHHHFATIKELFENRFYFALTKLHHPAEDEWLKETLSFAKDLESPRLFSQDIFFHTSQRKSLNDLLHAIRTNKPLPKASSHFFPNSERHIHSLKVLEARYSPLPGWEDSLRASKELSESCDWSLGELRYEYPKEMIPESFTPHAYLTHLTWKGLRQRLNGDTPEALKEKVLHELKLIEELGFADYFLTVWDIVRWAREQNILCQGRGSAANSIICWALGITAVHPGQFDLLVERFISKERGDPPDIDVDFEHERREEVLQYIYNRYGRAKAAMVANVITYRNRGALRAVGKAMGLSEEVLTEVTEASKSKRFSRGKSEELISHIESSLPATTRKNLPPYFSFSLWQQMAKELVGFPRHLGIHSGGFVLSQHPLDHIVPQEPATMPGRTVIQWSKDDLEGLGFFKIDLLSLGMLTALRKALHSVETHYGKKLELYTLPQDDPKTFKMIQQADTVGVFQIESRAQMSMLPRLKPETFYDLVIEVAIIRPGPIQGKVIHPYLRRRSGEEAVSYPPMLAPVLARTLGVAIFQEQAMRVAIIAGNFTAGEANELRRHIGVWNIKEFSRDIDPWLDRLQKGMEENGLEKSFIEQIMGQMKGFAHYGFPESHAVSFALLAYASSYLKCHYPAAFFSAVMNSQPMGFYSVHALLQAAKRDGVEVLPISVNHSDWDHKLEKTLKRTKNSDLDAGSPSWAIRLGLRIVHSLSKEAAERVMTSRTNTPTGTFESFDQFLHHARLYRNDLTALAAADAFLDLGLSRSEALWAAEACPIRPLIDEAEENFAWKPESILQRLQRDFSATGTSLGPHPTELFRKNFWKYAANPGLFSRAQDLTRKRNGLSVHCFGMILIRQAPGSAKGMVFVTLEDETGFINLAFTPHIYRRYYQIIDFSSFLCIKGRIQRVENYHSILVEEVFAETSETRRLYKLSSSEEKQRQQVASPQRSYH